MNVKNINLGLQVGNTFLEQAKAKMGTWGCTNLYSTGDPVIDAYFGGGFGRRDGYEIVTIFGASGCNKSTFMTSILLDAARNGAKIAYFALEDDPVDVTQRVLVQCDHNEEEAAKVLQNFLFMPENDGYTLDMMIEAIEKIFDHVDIIAIDPLGFIFEASVTERGETEFNRQRLFMRRINNLMKHTNKTLIIVSHTRKGDGKNQTQGLDNIIGSSAIAQVSTKVIEINRKDGVQGIRLWKTRFTPYRHAGMQVHLENMRVRSVFEMKELPQLMELWEGRSREE